MTEDDEKDASELRRTVADVLSRHRGRRVSVESVTARASPAATLFPVHELRVTLAGGEQLRIFRKCLSARQPDHPDKQSRDREVRIYEELFTDPELPVPRYFGHRHNAPDGTYELFLESVDADVLANLRVEHWFTAARHLGRLHAHFAAHADELSRLPWLLRFDTGYLLRWAERALSAVGSQSAELARELEPIVQDYRRVADPIALQPATLVHNDLAPKNVLVDTAPSPERVLLVDWELAGVGCGVLDLAHLKYGLSPKDDARICAEYRSELTGTALLPEDDGEFDRLAAACALHKNIFRLARGREWGVPLRSVWQWINETRELWQRF